MVEALILYAVVNSAVMGAFIAICVMLGFPVIGVKRLASRSTARPTFDELAIAGLGVWIAGWFIVLPVYYLDHLLNGDRYLSHVLALAKNAASWLARLEAAALIAAAIIGYCGAVGLLTFITAELVARLSGSRRDLSGPFAFWAMFGYLGIPFLMAVWPRL